MIRNKVTQVERKTVAQNILQQLIELIMNGTLAPGEKLPTEFQLMEMFGAGRSSLREAIKALAALGLIEVRVPEGTFVSATMGGFFTKQLALVSKISFDNIVELIEARIKIETDLAELAAWKSTEEELKELHDCLELMRTAENNVQFTQGDLQFHIQLGNMAKNSFLIHVLHILHDITATWIMKVIQTESSKKLAVSQHERIYQAVASKDPAAAGQAMTEHLESVSALLLEVRDKELKQVNSQQE
ncbi:FadR/GntR family transcriptional regulator [Paenibacillus montanisoli]|uniref:HTH gntR-type domain-containing protein n=1 Tax=Paenibacillus montanisoli TaxID=2081970 RepID=A0A328U9A5_9BACL|nr:FadR/GntR family transcriptional regulator [Paenibacillus montanisoli]RAP77921.1 hypothetical protein DL346_05550 [Paenibacillus montanisoli]